MDEEVITNSLTKEEIHLAKTNDINKLENQLMLLGIKGLFYSPWAKDIQKKIKKLKAKRKSKKIE